MSSMGHARTYSISTVSRLLLLFAEFQRLGGRLPGLQRNFTPSFMASGNRRFKATIWNTLAVLERFAVIPQVPWHTTAKPAQYRTSVWTWLVAGLWEGSTLRHTRIGSRDGCPPGGHVRPQPAAAHRMRRTLSRLLHHFPLAWSRNPNACL